MVLVRCAIVGRAVVTPVRVPLDATVHELQCAVEASVPLLVPCDCAHLRLFRATPRAAARASNAETTTAAARSAPQWLQMDDPALEVLLAPHTSAAHTSAADACSLRCTYLDPRTELLPEHTVRTALHCDSTASTSSSSSRSPSSTNDDEPTSPSGADVHVLVALPDEPALARPATLRKPATTATANDLSVVAPAPALHDADTDADDDMDGTALPLTDDPHLLELLEKQFSAMSSAHYELRPAPVPARAVAALRYRLARYDAEYGVVLSPERRHWRCVELIVAAVRDLLSSDRARSPELLARVTLPGDALRVLAKFDFTLQLGAAHVGVVVATQARKRAGMQRALQQSWLGAEVLADADSSRSVLGIVTNYTDWVFLRYANFQIYAHEATLEVGRSGAPTTASLAAILGLAVQMALGT